MGNPSLSLFEPAALPTSILAGASAPGCTSLHRRSCTGQLQWGGQFPALPRALLLGAMPLQRLSSLTTSNPL